MLKPILSSWFKRVTTVNSVVASGYWRARLANTPIIWAEVEADYADRMTDASRKQKRQIRAQMKREFRKRLRERVPSNALY